ncbi:hypothetical protein CRENBAI_010307 [Crenichthys baileyi]|uniref:Uncharacterized protein n=1 Tax=Crenichthys baileyi TaxID=28760 RepID=A0AAV9RFQ3_9TELE
MVRVKRDNRQAEEKRNACQDDEQATGSSTSSSETPIGIPVITYSTDDEDPTSTPKTTFENKISEEWSLEPYGLRGSWGYIFMYEIGELCLYQLDQDEVFNGSLALCTLTHNDWAVLRLAIPHLNDGPETVSMQEREDEEENELSPRPAKRARMSYMPSDVEIAEREPLFSAVWGSKTAENGRWSLRVSRRKNNRTNPSDLFVPEAFNQDCSIFKTMLALPFEAWAEKMGEIGHRLSNLFHNSRRINSKLTDTENRILRVNEATSYRDLYNHRAEIHYSPEHDESFNIGPYHPPSPDLFFSPSTTTSSFSETHFSPHLQDTT